ncbi:MAG TPA: HD domain-containing protein, partial [Actinomycetota bacterium]|nr:HD domain-containing protein [Actinomycetota bacterium]
MEADLAEKGKTAAEAPPGSPDGNGQKPPAGGRTTATKTKASPVRAPSKAPAKQNGAPPIATKLIPNELVDPKPQGVKGVFYRFRPQSSPPPIPKEILDIVRMVKEQHPKADTRGVVRAYEIAHLVHEGQKRKSGEEFIQHPVGVARILAEQGMDATTIIAAFLHDSVEDTSLELQELRTIFGDEVADIIDWLTKIDRIKFRSKEQERAENLRKMIVAMAKDMRVLIIKLADRLHNMRTIAPLAPDR